MAAIGAGVVPVAAVAAAVGSSSSNNGSGGSTSTLASVSTTPLVSVTVDGVTGNTTVAALTGNITLTMQDGSTVTVDIGTGAIISPNGKVVEKGVTLALLVKNNPALVTDLNSAVKAVSAYAQSLPAGSANAGQALTLLETMVKVASAANPSAAPSYVSTATSAIEKSPALAGQTNNAINAIVIAATTPGNGVDSTAVNNSASSAANSAGGSFTQNASVATSTAFVSPISNTVVSVSH